jgi:hypothetical protein
MRVNRALSQMDAPGPPARMTRAPVLEQTACGGQPPAGAHHSFFRFAIRCPQALARGRILAVDLAAVANGVYDNQALVLQHLVDHTVVADAELAESCQLARQRLWLHLTQVLGQPLMRPTTR